MSYCNVVDLQNYLPSQVIVQTTDDNDTDQIDQDKVNACIQQGDALIDSYIRGRYPVPVVEVPFPPMINNLSIRLAAYFLYKRGLYATQPKEIEREYETCNELLDKIKKGKINPFQSQDEPLFFATNKHPGQRVFSDRPLNISPTPSMQTQTVTGQNFWGSFPI